MAEKSPNIHSNASVEENFILVTEQNRKHSVVLGRTIYSLRRYDSKSKKVTGRFDIRPRLKKGWLNIENSPHDEDHSTFISQEEGYEEDRDMLKCIIDNGIKERILYIGATEKITKYKFSGK